MARPEKKEIWWQHFWMAADGNIVLSGRPSLDLTVGGHKEVESRRDWDQTGLNRNGQEPATKQVQQGHLGDGQSDIFTEMGLGT